MQCRACDIGMGAVGSGAICSDCESPPQPVPVLFFLVDMPVPKFVLDKFRERARDMICTRTISSIKLISFILPNKSIRSYFGATIHLTAIGKGADRRAFVSVTHKGEDYPVACTTNILTQQGHP